MNLLLCDLIRSAYFKSIIYGQHSLKVPFSSDFIILYVQEVVTHLVN